MDEELRQPERINWDMLQHNPAALNILEPFLNEEINWGFLTMNLNAVQLLVDPVHEPIPIERLDPRPIKKARHV